MKVDRIGENTVHVQHGDAFASLEFRDGCWVLSGVRGGEIRVEVGANPVVISKEYGPLIMCDVEIRPDAEAVQWVVSRDGVDVNADPSEFHECARIDAWYEGYDDDSTCTAPQDGVSQ